MTLGGGGQELVRRRARLEAGAQGRLVRCRQRPGDQRAALQPQPDGRRVDHDPRQDRARRAALDARQRAGGHAGGQQVRRAERHGDGVARRARGDDGGHVGQVGDGEVRPAAEAGDDLAVGDGALVARARARLHRLAPVGDVGLVVGGADAEGPRLGRPGGVDGDPGRRAAATS